MDERGQAKSNPEPAGESALSSGSTYRDIDPATLNRLVEIIASQAIGAPVSLGIIGYMRDKLFQTDWPERWKNLRVGGLTGNAESDARELLIYAQNQGKLPEASGLTALGSLLRTIIEDLGEEDYKVVDAILKDFNLLKDISPADEGELTKEKPESSSSSYSGFTRLKKLPKWVFLVGSGVIVLILILFSLRPAWLFPGLIHTSTAQVQAFTPTPSQTNSPTHTLLPTGTATKVIDTSTPSPTAEPSETPTQAPTLTPTHTPSPTALPNTIVQDGVTLVLIPAGNFMMGGIDGDQYVENEETPRHEIFLDAFYIDQAEVSNAQYARCVADGQCIKPSAWKITNEFYFESAKYANYPIVNVSWTDARNYCAWRGARLPTESEWEKAARGGKEGLIYPWGNEFDQTLANFCDKNCKIGFTDIHRNDGYAFTAPVNAFPPNSYTLFNIVGNVWEWVSDYYSSVYYSKSPPENPPGPGSGIYRVVRGGSWNEVYSDLRSSERYPLDPDQREIDIGFRCAVSP